MNENHRRTTTQAACHPDNLLVIDAIGGKGVHILTPFNNGCEAGELYSRVTRDTGRIISAAGIATS